MTAPRTTTQKSSTNQGCFRYAPGPLDEVARDDPWSAISARNTALGLDDVQVAVPRRVRLLRRVVHRQGHAVGDDHAQHEPVEPPPVQQAPDQLRLRRALVEDVQRRVVLVQLRPPARGSIQELAQGAAAVARTPTRGRERLRARDIRRSRAAHPRLRSRGARLDHRHRSRMPRRNSTRHLSASAFTGTTRRRVPSASRGSRGSRASPCTRDVSLSFVRASRPHASPRRATRSDHGARVSDTGEAFSFTSRRKPLIAQNDRFFFFLLIRRRRWRR